jgi:S1-C subfamily serine protease
MRVVVASLAALALVVSGCGGSSSSSNGKTPALGSGDSDIKAAQSQQPTSRVEVIKSIGRSGGFDPRALYKTEAPGVVTVVSLFGSGGLGSLLNGGGDGGGGVGSGFVLDGTGEIATNAHVVTTGQGAAIKRAREVYVAFGDGNQVPAKIVGTDPNADVALLKINTGGLRLRPLPLGDSSSVEVGEPVAAIGSPFNERQSLSVGVISAVDRTIESLTSFSISGALQTDAAINPGNSGGPLVDAGGHVIGINQQIKSTSGGGEGVGFAVPINAVKRSLAMLRDGGEAHYAYLGVSSVELYPQLVDHFHLDVDKGAWVQDVNAGGPADKAGIRGGSGTEVFQAQSFRPGGDVITKVAGRPVQNSAELADEIANFKPGDTVPLEVHRDGETKEIKVRLGERPLGNVAG